MIEVRLSPWDLLLWPLTLPIGGFRLVLEQLRDVANRELYDPDTLRRQLLEVQSSSSNSAKSRKRSTRSCGMP